MKWECEKSEAGHALAPARDEEALWSGWACSHCGERFKRPGDSDSYELPLMESVVEVDALALMLDGAVVSRLDAVARGRLISTHVLDLEDGNAYPLPIMTRISHRLEWAYVAQAILELEGLADWWTADGDEPGPCVRSELAEAAQRHAQKKLRTRATSPDVLREGAALLRDGWRPGKRDKRRAR